MNEKANSMITLRLSADEHARLVAAAKSENISLNTFLLRSLGVSNPNPLSQRPRGNRSKKVYTPLSQDLDSVLARAQDLVSGEASRKALLESAGYDLAVVTGERLVPSQTMSFILNYRRSGARSRTEIRLKSETEDEAIAEAAKHLAVLPELLTVEW